MITARPERMSASRVASRLRRADLPRLQSHPQLRRSQYPQVEPGALALAHRAVSICPPELTLAQAQRWLQRARARLLVVEDQGRVGVVRPEDLRRAEAFGLANWSVAAVAWWGVPVLIGEAPEVRVRRLLMAGAPFVLVKEGGAPVAAVEPAQLRRMPGGRVPTPEAWVRQRPGWAGGVGALSLAGRLERQLPAETLNLLRAVSRLGESLKVRAYVAGGFVRDLLRAAPSRDLDFVVEGNGLTLARRLCRQLKGTLVVHRAFGTASIRGFRGGRVDVAMARRERYAAPGALPTVTPASIAEDLARRDFSVNAMALALTGSAFGYLLDPFGGQRDLETRRIRILHPLSFVEDPTRIFRAVRYSTRLGLSIDRWTRRCMSVALNFGSYPALSGQRLLAELELILREPGWERSLRTLARLGAFRLLDRAYRFPLTAARRLRDLRDLLQWGGERGIVLDPLPLVLLCLVGHSPIPLAERCLRRLALSGEPLARLLEARVEGPSVARRLDAHATAPASQRAAILRARATETIAFAWLVGGKSARAQVQWFLGEGRGVRPLLSGEDLLALGVAKGPAVSRLLHRIRDRRLDGQVSSPEDEVRLVREWMTARAGTSSRTPEED